MVEEVIRTEVEREQGFIYFVKSVEGKLAIFRAKCGRPKKFPKEPEESIRPFEDPTK